MKIALIVSYCVFALLIAALVIWLLVRFLSCCCSPIDAAFCQLASTITVYKTMASSQRPPPIFGSFLSFLSFLSFPISISAIGSGANRHRAAREGGGNPAAR